MLAMIVYLLFEKKCLKILVYTAHRLYTKSCFFFFNSNLTAITGDSTYILPVSKQLSICKQLRQDLKVIGV